MNKEEIVKYINNQLIKEKVAEATNILMDMYELGFNNGFELNKSQLDIANKKLNKIKEYVDIELTFCNTTTLNEILKDILSIIGGE